MMATMPDGLTIDLADLRRREQAAKEEVLRRFGRRGTQPQKGSYGLSRKQRRLAKLMAEQERRRERDMVLTVPGAGC